MRQIFFLVLLFITTGLFAQAPSNYTNINGRYRWIAGMFDSTFHIPKGTTTSLRTGGSTNAGALFYRTTDSSVYYYTGTQWLKVAGAAGFVPYTGATQNVNLGQFGLKTKYVEFDTSSQAVTDRRLQWSNAEGTLQFGMTNGATITQRIGLEQFARVRNLQGDTIEAGDVVYISGASGDRAAVKLADNRADSTSSKTLGVATEQILPNDVGLVGTFGVVGKLNLSAFTAGDVVYLDSIPGKLTKVKPQAPYHMVFVGVVERANAGNGLLFVNVQNGYELEELHNVRITSPVRNNAILAYDSVGRLWKDTTLNAIGGITGSGTSGQVSYFNGTNSITSSPTFAFTPTSQLLVNNSVTAASAIARGINATPTLTAAANNDVLVGLDINPTFTNGAFTGVQNWGIRSQGSIYVPSNINGSGFGITIQNTNSGSSAISGMGFQNDQSQGTSILQYSSARNNVDNNNQYNCGPATVFDYQGAGSLVFSSSLSSGSNRGIRFFTGASSSNATEKVRIFANGNVTIQNGGTHTDAGFRLDVNGTARVQGNLSTTSSGTLTVAGATTMNGTLNTSAGLFLISSSGGNNQQLLVSSATWNLASNNAQSIIINSQTINPSSGGFYYAGFDFNAATINATSTYSGNIHGVRVSPSTINVANGNYYGVFTNANAATNVWNFYANGTANNYFGGNILIGTTTPSGASITTASSLTASSGIARGVNFTNTLVAAANNDVLVGLDINPTFTNGAFTGVTNDAVRITGLSRLNGNVILGGANDRYIHYNTTSTILAGRDGSAVYFGYNFGSQLIDIGSLGSGNIRFRTSGNTIVESGKLLVGTSTDAGFRLDVNGTARVQGNITQTGVNTSSLGYIRNDGTLGLVSNPPSASIIGILIGSVSNGGHTAIFTKGNNPGSTAIRVTDQNIGASVNHFIVDYAGSSGFGLPNGTTTVAASAQVEIVSTTKGFLRPRMTTAQRDAISTPATGLSVYNTSTNTNDYYNGSAWLNVGQVLVPANNTTGFSISGSSLTGSNAQSLVSLSQTWNTTGNPTAFLLNITNTASGATADLMELQVGGVAQFIVGKSGTIQTTAPAGGTAKPWKLGNVAVVSPTSPDRTIEVEIDGVTYYIHAKTTNN